MRVAFKVCTLAGPSLYSREKSVPRTFTFQTQSAVSEGVPCAPVSVL